MTRSDYGRAYQSGFKQTLKFLVSKGVRHDQAEEAAQAAWTRGWERINQLRDHEFLRTWVNAIALNMYRRAASLDGRKEILSDVPGGAVIDVAAIDLERVLRSCDASDRALLVHQLHGLSTTEMASAVGTTEAAVRLRLMRARRSARSIFEAGRIALSAA